ncbi:MAG TPA: HupE/UreJ family protein [Bacteroidales bacterium]|nr:HupE/UreJ family protein [Bacteroidales bacterium]
MNTFELYCRIGIEHIADFKGYDHILFILTLCGVYVIKEWKSILILITAFTIGHSISLAMAVLGFVTISAELIEFFIPVTIVITSVGNLFKKPGTISPLLQTVKYVLALFFGLIHGFGFSNYLKALLEKTELVLPLLSFNIGIELGQLIIVTSILTIATLVTRVGKVAQRDWNLVISGAGLGVSLIMSVERFPW